MCGTYTQSDAFLTTTSFWKCTTPMRTLDLNKIHTTTSIDDDTDTTIPLEETIQKDNISMDNKESTEENKQSSATMLKREILENAEKFKELQRVMFRMEDADRALEKQLRREKRANFIRRITFRKPLKNDLVEDSEVARLKKLKEKQQDRMKGLFGSASFGTASVNLGEQGTKIIELAEKLSKLNPTPNPTYGWKGYKEGNPKTDCLLNGNWKLAFTTGADATFRENPVRGKTITSQDANASEGTFTNVIDFEKGNIEGFRVVVEGDATSDECVDLTFKKVVILRKKRFPFFLKKIVIPLPSFKSLNKIVRFLTRGRNNRNRAYFKVRYLDEDFRMHKTGDDNWFIQKRIVEEKR